MDNNELAVAFAEECLELHIVKHTDNGTPLWLYNDSERSGHFSIPTALPQGLGDDTPEGWAAFKRWVEPWIKERGLKIAYDSGDDGACTLYSTTYVLKQMIEVHAITNGPLPTAAVKACLELVRKEKTHEQ